MKILESLAAAVPSGKAFFWIVGGLVSAFGAGLGFAFGFGDTAQNIALVPSIKESVELNTVRIEVLEDSVSTASSQRERILCIVSLNATGELMLASELNRICP